MPNCLKANLVQRRLLSPVLQFLLPLEGGSHGLCVPGCGGVGSSRASVRKGVRLGAEERVSQCSPGAILTVCLALLCRKR